MDNLTNKDVIFSDFHIHSRFSRACSKNITFENLTKWAKIKGLNLLGTGDFTHPIWFKEIKDKLIDNGNGFYLDSATGFPFIITGEISLMYSQGGKGRRVHLVLLVPSIEIAEKINSYFDKRGRRDYDGRPIFKISCEDFVKDMMAISESIEIIPAHIWTPWFGIFGSQTGFDSLKEAFGEQVENIHAIETGISCYDSKTEILTEKGWKFFKDVNKSDNICTLDPENYNIEFQKPLNIFKRKYKGKMYKLETKRVNLLVTPNHKLFYSHCDFRKKPNFSLKKAELLFNKSKRFKKDGNWRGKNQKYFVLPKVRIKHGSKYYSGERNKEIKKFPIKEWLRFFGFWIAEGCTHQGKNGDYGVYIFNDKKDVLLEMKKILEGFGYRPYLDKNILRVRDFQLFKYLDQFGKSGDKYIPLEIKSLSKELLQLFFDYYIKGDGHRYGRNNKGLSATTISKKLRDDLQEVALKLGMSAYYKLHNKKGTSINSLPVAKSKGYKQSKDSWNVYFIKENLHTVIPSTIKKWNYKEKWIQYNDYVYCVQVPNHVIYIRRNGIPVWCGNSDPEMNWKIKELTENNISIVSFSDAHSHWPFRLGRETTIFKKTNSYKEIIRQIRENDFIGTIETEPAYGKYHWDGHRNCNFSCSPNEAKELNYICPICGNPLTRGVENRVEFLAGNPENFKPKSAKFFYKLLPLHELIVLVYGGSLQSKKNWEIYDSLIKEFGNEFNVLLNVSKEKLLRINLNDKLVEMILKNREGKIKVKPGYDGVYGEALLEEKQSKLF